MQLDKRKMETWIEEEAARHGCQLLRIDGIGLFCDALSDALVFHLRAPSRARGYCLLDAAPLMACKVRPVVLERWVRYESARLAQTICHASAPT